jgi:hypothetical protein
MGTKIKLTILARILLTPYKAVSPANFLNTDKAEIDFYLHNSVKVGKGDITSFLKHLTG